VNLAVPLVKSCRDGDRERHRAEPVIGAAGAAIGRRFKVWCVVDEVTGHERASSPVVGLGEAAHPAGALEYITHLDGVDLALT